MQIQENTPYSDITIQGLTFSVPQPYDEGHQITKGEASALNQTLAENLRNNFAVKIRNWIEDHKKANNVADEEEVGADVLDKDNLDQELLKYAQSYEFGVRAGPSGPRAPADPVGREAFRMAWDVVKAALQKKNIKLDSVSKDQKDTLIKGLLSKRPDITDEAKRRVETTAQFALEDLGL